MPKIKQLLEDQQKSVTWLANQADIDRPMMSHIVHGDCLPVPPVMGKMISALKRPVYDLYDPQEIDYSTFILADCAHRKNERAHSPIVKRRADIYNFCAKLQKTSVPTLNREVLRTCGFYSNAEFMRWAVDELDKKYSRIKKREQAAFEKTRSQIELEKISD